MDGRGYGSWIGDGVWRRDCAEENALTTVKAGAHPRVSNAVFTRTLVFIYGFREIRNPFSIRESIRTMIVFTPITVIGRVHF